MDDTPPLPSQTLSGALLFVTGATPGLLVWHNEPGFRSSEVEALCRPGMSTKRGAGAATGEKGVGFKGVFALTDRPEIYSNGFRFAVEARSDVFPMAPAWIDSSSAAASSLPASALRALSDVVGGTVTGHEALGAPGAGTFKWLPANAVAAKGWTAAARQACAGVTAGTILFLRRLERLSVGVVSADGGLLEGKILRKCVAPLALPSVAAEGAALAYSTAAGLLEPGSSERLSEALDTLAVVMVETQHVDRPSAARKETGAETTKEGDRGGDVSIRRWLVGGKAVEITAKRSRRAGVKTTVRVALPVRSLGGDNTTATMSEVVYATLPVRDVGLGIAADAEWELTGNREDIDSSKGETV